MTGIEEVADAVDRLNAALVSAGLKPLKALVVEGGQEAYLEVMAFRSGVDFSVQFVGVQPMTLCGVEVRPEYPPAGPVGRLQPVAWGRVTEGGEVEGL